jgi:hypothetical protein
LTEQDFQPTPPNHEQKVHESQETQLLFYSQISNFRRFLLVILGIWFLLIQVRFFQEGGAGFSVAYIMEMVKISAVFYLLTALSQTLATIMVLGGLCSIAIYGAGWFFSDNKTLVSLVAQFHALVQTILGTPKASYLGVVLLAVLSTFLGIYLYDETMVVETPLEEEAPSSEISS